MAKSSEKTEKGGAAERGVRFLRDVHIGIGAAALAGAVLFPMVAALPVIAAYEGVNAAGHELVRDAVDKRKRKPPK